MPAIEDLLHRRSDLSTFLVHLTRSSEGTSARERLLAILTSGWLLLGRPLGMAAHVADAWKEKVPGFYRSQQVICFTETPLEHTWMMCEEIANRQVQLEPYGIAITKTWARREGINPVWYLDITPGHDWLTQPVNKLVSDAEAAGNADAEIFKLTPFIEQMGPTAVARKEFWWEREWRRARQDLLVRPENLVAVLVPETDHIAFLAALETWRAANKVSEQWFAGLKLIDPRWGLERIVARLAGVPDIEAGPFPP